MKKCISALAVILLILAATACTQYQYNWEDFLPGGKPITSEEEFRLFLLDNGSKSARVNVTIDPTSSSYPIEIKGTKKISGRIEIAESRGPVYFSSTAASSRATLLENLFIVGTGAILESDSLTINVNDSAERLFNSVIEVSGGTIRGEKLNIRISDNSLVIGLYIGEETAAENVRIENSNPGKIDIDEKNDDSENILSNITGNNPSIPQGDITTRFDAATESDFETALASFGRVRLMADIHIESKKSTAYVLPETESKTYEIDLNDNLLDIQSHGCFNIQSGSRVTIRNGNLNVNWIEEGPDKNEASDLGMYSNSSLILDNVEYTSEGTAVFLRPTEKNITLIVKDSVITSQGSYGISTNAKAPESSNINITVDNSKVSAKFVDGIGSTGIMLNVPGTLIVRNGSVITGTRNGITLRGGTANISDSEIISTGEFDDSEIEDKYLNGNWSTDIQAPYAALIVGNRTKNTYVYPTTCTITNSEITNNSDSHYASRVYVASSNGQKVTFNSSQYADEVKSNNLFYQEDGSTIMFSE